MAEEEFKVPTPFGGVHVPVPSIPKFQPPKIDERRGEAMAHAIAIDLSSVIGWIPIVGDIVADVCEDLDYNELQRILTPTELAKYNKEDRVAPSTIAMLRTFMEVP